MKWYIRSRCIVVCVILTLTGPPAFLSLSLSLCKQDARHLPQLPPPDPRYDTRMQGDQQQRGSLGGGGADASSAHLRVSTDGSYYRGQQQGAGGQV